MIIQKKTQSEFPYFCAYLVKLNEFRKTYNVETLRGYFGGFS